MADHTIVNLLEVEDSARKFGMPDGLEDGAEVLAFGAGDQGDTEMIQDFW